MSRRRRPPRARARDVELAEDVARDPTTGVYEPTGDVSPIASSSSPRITSGAVPGVTGPIDTVIDLVGDFLKGEALRAFLKGLADAFLMPLEALLDLLRNGARLVVIGGVIYLLGPPLVSGYVSGKVAARDRRRRKRR